MHACIGCPTHEAWAMQGDGGWDLLAALQLVKGDAEQAQDERTLIAVDFLEKRVRKVSKPHCPCCGCSCNMSQVTRLAYWQLPLSQSLPIPSTILWSHLAPWHPSWVGCAYRSGPTSSECTRKESACSVRERQGCHRSPLSRSTWAKCMPPGGGLRCRSVDDPAPGDRLPCSFSLQRAYW